jgi:predicted aldo/keto reductase-like oxidoreductase
MVKAETDYTQKLVEQCMQELVQDFQDWYGLSHALNDADWQKCSHRTFLINPVDDAKAANVILMLHVRIDMCLLIMRSTCPNC